MRFFYAFLLILTIFSCTRGAYKPPENLIPEDQMVDVLYEYMLLNSAKGINKKILEKHIVNPTQYVFDKFDIDSIQFAESNTYYAHNSEVYASIYASLKEKLELNKKAMEDLIADEKKKRDSLQNLNRVRLDSLKKTQQIKRTPKNRLPSKRFDSMQKRNR